MMEVFLTAHCLALLYVIIPMVRMNLHKTKELVLAAMIIGDFTVDMIIFLIVMVLYLEYRFKRGQYGITYGVTAASSEGSISMLPRRRESDKLPSFIADNIEGNGHSMQNGHTSRCAISYQPHHNTDPVIIEEVDKSVSDRNSDIQSDGQVSNRTSDSGYKKLAAGVLWGNEHSIRHASISVIDSNEHSISLMDCSSRTSGESSYKETFDFMNSNI